MEKNIIKTKEKQILKEMDSEYFVTMLSICRKLSINQGELKPQSVISTLPKNSEIQKLFILGHKPSEQSFLQGNIITTIGYQDPTTDKFITIEFTTKGYELWFLRISEFKSPKAYRNRSKGKKEFYKEIYSSLPGTEMQIDHDPQTTEKILRQWKQLDESLGDLPHKEIIHHTQKDITKNLGGKII